VCKKLLFTIGRADSSQADIVVMTIAALEQREFKSFEIPHRPFCAQNSPLQARKCVMDGLEPAKPNYQQSVISEAEVSPYLITSLECTECGGWSESSCSDAPSARETAKVFAFSGK
jgi:hypothetical protein